MFSAISVSTYRSTSQRSPLLCRNLQSFLTTRSLRVAAISNSNSNSYSNSNKRFSISGSATIREGNWNANGSSGHTGRPRVEGNGYSTDTKATTQNQSQLNGPPPRTLFDKIWDSHLVDEQADGNCVLYVDAHLVHEVTSPQAFEGLRNANRTVRRPDCTLVTPDHNVTTSSERVTGGKVGDDEQSLKQLDALDKNAVFFQLPYFPLKDIRQGIVHIIGPEQGFTQPGKVIVCGDSHTATHGAFGALAHGIGTSEVEHVLATQTLLQRKAKNMRVTVEGDLPLGITSKDVVLAIIGKIGTAGGTGHVIEYAGSAIRNFSMEARMTICNMSIEAGARAGLIAPDEVTINYMKGRPMAPSEKTGMWEKAVEYWKTLPSDEGAHFDKEVFLDAQDIEPQVTWGTNPEMVGPINGTVPDPNDFDNEDKRNAVIRALEYMGLKPGTKLQDIAVDTVFVGSCTNARIEDLRALVEVVKGHKVKDGLRAMVVPGSGLVKKQAQEEGIIDLLKQVGFDVREPGCSMCLGMNGDQLGIGERCASTSNRNFEGRQGKGGRTHLVSPAMAGAAAITGRLTDVREFTAGSRRSLATKSTNAADTAKDTATAAGMKPFVRVKSVAAPMPSPNIDTDSIIPAVYLKTIKRTGLGKNLFAGLRYDAEGKENQDFVLNQEPYRNAEVLIVGDNFGCGSSREHAPWALLDFGIRCVISTSFADIFFANCFKNGILPFSLPQKQIDTLMQAAKDEKTVSVDLESQKVAVLGHDGETEEVSFSFEVDPFRKHCLLNGLDDIGLTLQKEDRIRAYEEKRRKEFPWLEGTPLI